MENCVFCKIVAGSIPNYTVYEDKYVLAFLDIHPCAKGHTVVIPKKHASSFLKLSTEEWRNISSGLMKAVKKVQDALDPDGLNIGINEKPAAGQAVPHMHWHILPRWENDGGGNVHSIVQNAEGVDVQEVAELFKS
ncbi:MAG: HIT family protein [bacterium]